MATTEDGKAEEAPAPTEKSTMTTENRFAAFPNVTVLTAEHVPVSNRKYTGTFPSSHMTLTQPNPAEAGCKFDPYYMRSIPGFLKLLQLSFDLLGFVTVAASRLTVLQRGLWFTIASGLAFAFTMTLLIFYFFHFIERFQKIPWILIEFVYCGIWTIFFMTVSCLLAVESNNQGFLVGSIFGFLCVVVYGYDTYLKFCKMREKKRSEHQTTNSNNRISRSV